MGKLQKFIQRQSNKFPIGFGVAMFVNMIFYAMVSTVLFSFLPKMVKYFGASEVETGYKAGVIATSFYIGQFVFSMAWGYAADTMQLKHALILAGSCLSITTVLFGLSRTFYWAFISRFLQGSSMGHLIIFKALINVVCEENNIAFGLSLMMSAFTVGSIVGPSIGGFLAFPADQYPRLISNENFFGKFGIFLPNLVLVVGVVVGILLVLVFIPKNRKVTANQNAEDLPNVESQQINYTPQKDILFTGENKKSEQKSLPDVKHSSSSSANGIDSKHLDSSSTSEAKTNVLTAQYVSCPKVNEKKEQAHICTPYENVAYTKDDGDEGGETIQDGLVHNDGDMIGGVAICNDTINCYMVQDDAIESEAENSHTVKNDAINSDSVKYYAVISDSVRYKAVKDDTINSDPVKDDTRNSDPVKDDAINSDPVKDDTRNSDPVKDDAINSDPVKDDARNSDPVKDDAINSDPVKDDAINSDLVKDNPINSDPVKDDPINSDPVKDDPINSDLVKDNAINRDPVKDDPINSDPVKDNSINSDPVKDDAINSEPVKDDAINNYSIIDEVVKKYSAKDYTVEYDTARKDALDDVIYVQRQVELVEKPEISSNNKDDKNGRFTDLKNSKFGQVLKTKDALLTAFLYMIFGMLDIGYNEILPVLTSTSISYRGMNMTPSQLGTILLIAPTCYFIPQVTIGPKLVTRFGPKSSFIVLNLVLTFCYAILPVMAAIHHRTVLYICLISVIIVIRVSVFGCMVAINILINNSVTSDLLGTINGAASSAIALGRLIAPIFFGSIYSWSLTNIVGVRRNKHPLGFPFNQFFTFFVLSIGSVLIAVITTFLPDSINDKKVK